MKADTQLGKLFDLALRVEYGDDFQWEKATITKDVNGNYVVEIDSSEQALLEETK